MGEETTLPPFHASLFPVCWEMFSWFITYVPEQLCQVPACSHLLLPPPSLKGVGVHSASALDFQKQVQGDMGVVLLGLRSQP